MADSRENLDVRETAARMMREILGNRQFQQHWIEEVAESLAVRRRVQRSPPAAFHTPPSTAAESPRPFGELDIMLNDLRDDCDRATSFFLRGAPLASQNLDAKFNPDAATLFELKANLEKIRDSGRFQLPRFLLFGRQLRKLLKAFAASVSSPFDISRTRTMAATLCDVLFMFEEVLAIQLPQQKSTHLQRSIDRFNVEVVKHLNRWQLQMLSQRPSTPGKKSVTPSRCDTRHTCASGKSTYALTVLPERTPSRPKSFLIPCDLARARERVQQRSRSATRHSTPPRRPVTSASEKRPAKPFRRSCCGEKVAEKRDLLESSWGNDVLGRSALRYACQVTREVVDEFSKRV